MLLRRKTVIDRDIERKILTSLITSTKVLNNASPYLKPKLFNLDISRRISRWILDYYSVYKEAPKAHIQDIYRQHQMELKDDEGDDVKEFLSKLSQDYSEEEVINEDYLVDQTLTYLKKLHLLNVAEEVKVLAESDHVEEAEALFRKGVKQASQIQGGWVKPLDDVKFVTEVFTELENPMVEFTGEFAKIINKIYPGWFFAVEAAYKSGKTQMMLQIAKECLMARKRVAFFSLEMIDRQMGPQIFKSIGGLGNKRGKYPLFRALTASTIRMIHATNHRGKTRSESQRSTVLPLITSHVLLAVEPRISHGLLGTLLRTINSFQPNLSRKC
jgi:hypothetical protein